MLPNRINARLPPQLRKVGAKHDLLPARRIRKRQKLLRVVLGRPRARVDVHVLMFPRHAHRLARPRPPDVPAHDLQRRKRQRHLIYMRNRPPDVAGTRRRRVAHLRQERHVQLDALGVQRPVVRVRRRQPPQPRHDAQADELLAPHVVLELRHRVHRVVQVDGGEPEDACRVGPCVFGDLRVGEDGLPRPRPGREADLRHAGAVHQCDQLVGRAREGGEGGVGVAVGEKARGFGDGGSELAFG